MGPRRTNEPRHVTLRSMRLKSLRVAVTGGAGFIGSHLVDELLALDNDVVVFDDFSTGKRENLAQHAASGRLHIIHGDVRDLAALEAALDKVDVVFHLAVV